MLGYHSSLEADEIPYSWLVVYCQLSGLPSTRLLLERSQLAHCQLASQLPGYIPLISKTIGVPESKLINKHTTLPLFRCFLHEKTYFSVFNNLAEGNGSNLHSRMSLLANRVSAGTVLRACTECIKDDLENVGRAWWHLQHQLPGCSVCLKHCEPLIEVEVRRRELIQPTQLATQHPLNLSEIDIQLSGLIDDAWHRNQPVIQYNDILNRYRQRLVEAGLAPHMGAIRQVRLRQTLRAYWSESTSPVVQQLLLDNCYPENLFRAQRAQFHPLKHLLLIGMLWNSWQEFVEYNINEPGLHESCDANFLNEDSSDADILRLLRDGRSLREASQHFKRSIIYVKKIAVQHNVQVDRRPKRIFGIDRELIIGMLKSGVKTHQIAHKVDCSVGAIEQILSQHPDIVECRQQMRFKAKCLEHQNCILSALSEHPDFHRGEIQRECRASYTWLFKHNQQWLYEHVPPAIPRQYRYQGRKNNQKNEH